MTGEHLLIVDDEDNLRSMLAAALQHHGFTVSTAANGRQALEAIPKDSPDLVLLDVMMPDLDGFEVPSIASRWRSTPVLFLTARDPPRTRCAAWTSAATITCRSCSASTS